MNRFFTMAALTSTLALVGCGGPGQSGRPEAHSLIDGRPLHAPARSPEVEDRLEWQLAEALSAYESEPSSEDALIWYGRRLAYLGRYREAIDIYTRGLQIHPESPRLHRHRGHRFISIREFNRAIREFTRAADVIEQRQMPDEIEPDGMPNAAGVPRSTLHSNIFYHWALAHYLSGEFARAAERWSEGLNTIEMNDDMRIAFLYWLHNALVRAGRIDEAQAAIEDVHERMDILENHAYHDLLLLFKGAREESSFAASIDPDASFDATLAYGVAMHHLAQGDEAGWRSVLESIVAQRDQWASFGSIAAEADLARRGS